MRVQYELKSAHGNDYIVLYIKADDAYVMSWEPKQDNVFGPYLTHVDISGDKKFLTQLYKTTDGKFLFVFLVRNNRQYREYVEMALPYMKTDPELLAEIDAVFLELEMLAV